MTVNHVVVDGSNLATEGRTLPSLQQLDDAVRAFIDEFTPKTVTVVVDASFPNRIDESERAVFEEAILAGELISPPAGVIGRGDAFLLQIADRADAVVLSNDSFQEFHGQYAWLFDQGRLIGGKPVPHVGWVFMDRSPVRGPLSRRSVSDAKKAAARTEKRSDKEAKEPSTARSKRSTRSTRSSASESGTTKKSGDRGTKAKPTPAKSAALSAGADEGGGGRRRRGSGGGVEPYNAALPFIEFVSAHPVGSTVEGEVERFASHGAYVMAEGTRCYLALKNLGDPPPRSAREVLSLGQRYKFVVHAIDTPRRGVDLTMPGVVPISAGDLARVGAASDPVPDQPEEERVAPAKKAAAKKTAAKKRAAAKKAPTRKKAAAKKAPTRKKAAAKKAPARKKAAAKRAPARKTAKKATKKSTKKSTKKAAKKRPAKKAAKKRPAKKAPARKKKAAKRTTKKAPARKAAKRTTKKR